MTTDTQSAPTDAELMDLGHECELDAVAFGRAVLAKWGAQHVPAGYALVPVEPSAEMVDAAQEAYMPFGDMQLAIQLAIAAARARMSPPPTA